MAEHSFLNSHDRRMALSFGAIILILMLTAAGIASSLFNQLNRKEEDRLSGTIAILLAESISRVSFSGKYHTRLFIEELQSKVPELVFISVESSDGQVVAHSLPEKNDEYLKGAEETSLRAQSMKQRGMATQNRLYDGQIIKELAFPIHSSLNNEITGVVRVGVRMEQVRREQRTSIISVLFLIALLTAAAFIAVLLLSHRLGNEHRTLAAQLKGILHHAPIPICISNRDNQLIAASSSFARLFDQQSPGQNLGALFNAHLSPESSNRLLRIFKEVVLQGTQQGKDVDVERQGQPMTWHVSTFPIGQNHHKETTMICSFIHDITERKQHEQNIMEAKDQWKKTFDAIDSIITIHDREMRILRANKAAGDLFHCAPAALVGRHCYELFRNAQSPCEGCPEALSSHDRGSQRAVICHENMGRTFETASFPLHDHNGLVGFVHIAKDITKSLQLEKQLKQAQKMEAIGTLAGGIAHDFNNILTPILGYTEIALTRGNNDTSLTTELQQIKLAALRAKELVQQILAFSRQSTQEKISLLPHLVVKEVLKLLRASLPATIEISTDISADCGSILADPTQFHQIVMNLCTNAYHAMEETGGTLEVRLKAVSVEQEDVKVTSGELLQGPYVLLEISDTGCGIDKAIRERIFEPYFTTKDSGKGTGLGLSMVHGIVKSYQGHIQVYSEPGRGTTFQIYLPRIAAKPAATSESSPQSLPTGTERVLIVDDEGAITNLLHTILHPLGYQTTCLNDSQKALTLLTQQPDRFDLLITDMTMPHLTGVELARAILRIRPALPIILCTGFSELINKEQAHAIGIDYYLTKPVSVLELTMTIRQALNTRTNTGTNT